jgi:hypothetical protein
MNVFGRTTATVNTDAHDIFRPSYFRKWVIPEVNITEFNIAIFAECQHLMAMVATKWNSLCYN